MKKILLSLGMFFLSLSTATAGKAWPYPITIVQSNGQPITVYLHGNDEFHWYTDTQGRILQRKGNDFTVLDIDPKTFLAQADKEMQAKAMKREPISKKPSLFPHTGTPRAVVILAEYQNRKFSLPNPRKSFDQYLNATDGRPKDFGFREDLNYGSVKQYFIDQSDSAFAPQFDIYGPITLPNNMEYYGGTSDNGRDERYTQLLIDACTAMNDSLDFTPYDQDGDGNIDLVYIIYAGYGQSSGAENYTMWPKRFSGFINPKFDGKGVNIGGISNELMGYEGSFDYTLTEAQPEKNFETANKRINGIGLFCHEFSHCLGLPDFYPTTLSTYHDNQGMEDWSLMDNGEYVNMGYCPTGYTAWEREAMGWDHIPTISGIKPYELLPEKEKRAVKIVNPNNSNEYFVLELFEDKGWNQRIARYVHSAENVNYNPETRGMLIYHVDYNANDFSLSSNNVNNVVGHPKMTVVPADGRLVSSYRINDDTKSSATGDVTSYEYARSLNGDLFRVDADHNYGSFVQSTSLVNSSWWTTAPDTPIENISYQDGKLYFDLKASTTAIRTAPVVPSGRNEKIYTIDGRYVGTSADSLPHGIYIRGGKKFVK